MYFEKVETQFPEEAHLQTAQMQNENECGVHIEMHHINRALETQF